MRFGMGWDPLSPVDDMEMEIRDEMKFVMVPDTPQKTLRSCKIWDKMGFEMELELLSTEDLEMGIFQALEWDLAKQNRIISWGVF